jgi:hypothetical protein
MKIKIFLAITIFVLFTITGVVFAQDFGFGFGDDTETSDSPSPSLSPVAVKVGGEIAVELVPFVHDFKKEDGAGAISFRDIFSGNLKFNLAGKNVEAISSFNLNADAISELWDASPLLSESNYTPLIIDEAFLRGWIGPVNIEAGLRKLTWGKADSLGPLDVINPMDYTDLRNMIDIQAVKIARPMVHVSWNTNGFSKLEAVFIPNFAGHRFAQEGRWTPAQFGDMYSRAESGIFSIADAKYGDMLSNPLIAGLIDIDALFEDVRNNMVSHLGNNIALPSTSGLEYFQTGLRFTTTIGPADIGFQYFYGNLFRPDFAIFGIDAFLADLVSGITSSFFSGNSYLGDPNLLSPQIKYNRYHQIGLDYAQVLAGFNVRAEFAVHLTEDLKGYDGSVRNPFIGWSLGFDRDLFWGINANVQCNETIRLMNDKVGNNPILDCEADTDITSTRITMRLSKKFFRDELECRTTAIWGIEDRDSYIIPALIWTVGDFSTELSAGIFVGDKNGELGQYWENSFVKIGLKYSF